jgi:hypothetical protein
LKAAGEVSGARREGFSAAHKVEWLYVAPDRPTQTGFVKGFNGRTSDDLLNLTTLGIWL